MWLLSGTRAATAAAAVPAPRAGENDLAYYEAVVARVRAGESYYDAAEVELRARRFLLGKPVAWREPTSAWLLAALPSPLVASGLLVAIGAAVVLLARRALSGSAWRSHVLAATAIAAVTMASAFVRSFVFFTESWAGLLIALSVTAFAAERWRLGVAAALAALAFRELALLPCVVGLGLAVLGRRRAEVAAWLVGLAAWGAFEAWHVSQAARHIRPDDVSHGFLGFGGAAAVLATSRWNSLLVALPPWAVALVLPVVFLGLGGAREPPFPRAALIVLGYLAVFVVAGHLYTDYWGALYAPLLMFGFVAAPASLRDLGRALVGPSSARPFDQARVGEGGQAAQEPASARGSEAQRPNGRI
jgi:hypothetical protein